MGYGNDTSADLSAMEDEEMIQQKRGIQKSSDGTAHASPALVSQLSNTKGGGQALPKGVQREIGQ